MIRIAPCDAAHCCACVVGFAANKTLAELLAGVFEE